MVHNFTHTTLGKTGIEVYRLGLSGTYGADKAIIYKALDAGINYFFCDCFNTQMTALLRDVLKKNRERYIIATGAHNLLWFHQNLRQTLEKRLRQLNTDYIDVFLFLSLPGETHFTEKIREELSRFREEGKVRSFGVSTHNRQSAGKLASVNALDVIMLRYNAAHRGAEIDIFPYLKRYNPGVVSYTATRWQHLLRRPKNWPAKGPIPTAGLCYRFVLSNPNIHICLTAPSNVKELEENLEALNQGPLSEKEMEFMHKFGDAVHQAHYKEMFNEKLTSLKMTVKHLMKMV